MAKLFLFTDGSVNPKSKIGYGACLWTNNIEQTPEELKTCIQTRRFENTSSTRLELQTLLWALAKQELDANEVIIYTDSQNMAALPERRSRLEEKNYRSKKNDIIQNAELYKEFYILYDKLNFEIVKVKGHKQSKNKNAIDAIFTLVDRASRNALRIMNKRTL